MSMRDARKGLGRRGLVAGIAATIGAGLARLAGSGRAEAAHDSDVGYDSQTVLHVNQVNTTSGVTRVASNSTGSSALDGLNSTASGTGVYGFAGSNFPPQPIAGAGVYGSGPSVGVRGDSGDGNGVFGVSTNATGAYGFSGNSFGVIGSSSAGVGVRALSNSNWGLHASSPIFAGVFSGAVYVSGNFTVTNGAKSAAVKRSNGTHSRVYCQESPEPWFEDFGTGQLVAGKATIPLDPDFDDVVKSDDYLVFLTPHGDCKGLAVTDRKPGRFTVAELQGGTSGIGFAFRVVARRKDPVGRRLETVDVPDFSKVKPLPPPPELPAVPEDRGRTGR